MIKSISILFILFYSIQSFGQFNESAPWMNFVSNKSSDSKITLKEQSNAFNAYWKGKDFKKKGSGFKPFKRWENHWENNLLENGTIATPKYYGAHGNKKDYWLKVILAIGNLKGLTPPM